MSVKARISVAEAIVTAIANSGRVPQDLVYVYAYLLPEDEWHKTRWEVFLEPIEMRELELEHNLITVQVDGETGAVIPEKAPEITREPDSFSRMSYYMRGAMIKADGIISIPAHGAKQQEHWDGNVEILSPHADYEFWLWLIKRWTYHSRLSSEDIPALKAEFANVSRCQ